MTIWITLIGALGALLLVSPPVAAEVSTPAAKVDAVPSRFVPLEASRNFRDLGGYETADGRTVKWGVIYRSGTMNRLTERDFAALRQLGVRTIVDFRSTDERRQEPFAPPRGLTLAVRTKDYALGMSEIGRTLSAPNATAEDTHRAFEGFYRRIPFEFADQYRALFAELLSRNVPIVINCSAGKDRTGIAAALVLTALGVPQRTIMQDYLLSKPEFQPLSARAHASLVDPRTSRINPELLAILNGVDARYLKAAFAAMESRPGGIEGYFRNELRLTPADIERLKSLYLE